MHRETIVCLMVAAAGASALPRSAQAQGRRRPAAAPATAPAAAPAPAAAAAAPTGDDGAMTFGVDETQQAPTANQPPPPPPPTLSTGAETSTAGASLEGIGGEDVRAVQHEIRESITSVQQIYALRNRRFELQPTFGVSLNDPYVTHYGVGVAGNYWITNVLAVGANFMWNQGLNSQSDVGLRVARSAQLVVPQNEYQMMAAVNFTYVPVYGKFLMFNRFIFHYDLYLTVGAGITRTRPIPTVDYEVRRFDFGTAFEFNVGIGVRVFVNRWLGIVAELRNYIYPESLENTVIATQDSPVPAGGQPIAMSRQDPRTWTQQSSVTDNVMIQVGLCVFLPFDVTYRLQK